MKYLSFSPLILLSVFLLHGCATLTHENTEGFRKDNQERLRRLTPGMTKDLVIGTMGTDAVVRCLHSRGGMCLEFETIDNPYRRAYVDAGGKQYEILYYYTDDQKRDLLYYYQEFKKHESPLHDDQLTPVLLADGKLVGWGKDLVDLKLKAAATIAK